MEAGEHKRLQVGARRIERRGEPRATGSDNYDFFHKLAQGNFNHLLWQERMRHGCAAETPNTRKARRLKLQNGGRAYLDTAPKLG